jgi:carboxypeptidase C (cathepsin A)
MKVRLILSLVVPALTLLCCVAGALQHADAEPADEAEKDADEEIARTSHSVVIGQTSVEYEAAAGSLLVREDGTSPKARIFFVSYERRGTTEPAQRPITFCFNGGPGSSSVWLHMGAFGPRRVSFPDDAVAPPPPYALVDNEHSILDLTDLVFIDPVTTGYSRAATGEDSAQFHGVQRDLEVVAEFVRLYTTRFGRWAAPKFLAGESYGTTRAAGLATVLQDRHGMYLNGVVLVSSILNFLTARFDTGNDLPPVLFLPTYTATAWYHGKLAPELSGDLTRTLALVEEFALREYAPALMLGDRLGAETRAHVVRELARFTGLSPEYVARTNLRIDIQRFVKELRRDERTTVGRLDSRFVGADADAAGESNEYDPSYSAIQGPYTALLNAYVRGELGYSSDVPYEILTGRVRPWDWGTDNRYLDMGERLRSAMTRNPHLHVFVANGYYDLATPYFATRYTFDHLGLEPALAEHVTMTHYAAGHMMYIHGPSLAALKQDLATFYGRALAR